MIFFVGKKLLVVKNLQTMFIKMTFIYKYNFKSLLAGKGTNS